MSEGVPEQPHPAHPALPAFETIAPSIDDGRRKSSAPSLQLRTTFFPSSLAPHEEAAEVGVGAPRSATPRPLPLALSAATKDYLYTGASPSSPLLTSPALALLKDVTPLPSPIAYSRSPDLWRKVAGLTPHEQGNHGAPSFPRPPSPGRKKKLYPGLTSAQPSTAELNFQNHGKNRSISDYIPDPLHNVRQRTVTMGPGSGPPQDHARHLHREEHAATQRRVVTAPESDAGSAMPSPSPSSEDITDGDEWDDIYEIPEETLDILEVRNYTTNKTSKWRPISRLGEGAFSEVLLATQEPDTPGDDHHKSDTELVAIKVVNRSLEQGPDDDRVGNGLKREIDILQHISHPCLPQLKGFDENEQRTLLVLNYCPGGDLFEFASQQRDLLTPALIQRIFAEIVSAVSYLHQNFIVHRDIKLENVLLNVPLADFPTLPKLPSVYPHPLATLTDLGLSRRISPPPESPLLTHACGSGDYAAPELLLGQPYDGRATDVWALGVLLYALLEGRLPFDAMAPGPNGRRRAGGGTSVKHRIARVDWLWVEYGDEDGEWREDTKKGKELFEASQVVDGCLKKVGRGRWSVQEIEGTNWVREGIQVDGGLTLG